MDFKKDKLIIEKLFSKYKKDNWEVKNIGEISKEVISGKGVTREQLGSGNYPAVKCGDINSFLPLQFKECISFVDLNLIKKPKYFEHGDLLLSTMGGKDSVGIPTVYIGKDKCLAGEHVTIIKTNQNTKFLAHFLSSNYAKTQIKKLAQKSTVYDLYSSKIKQIKIPIPPIEIQKEIVEFLDKFFELKQELERELEERKKQYEYYKNLAFNRGIKEQNWPIKTIEQIATDIFKGNGITKEHLKDGDYPAIRFTEIFNSEISISKFKNFVNPDLIERKKYIEPGDILMATTSNIEENIGKTCVYLGKEKCLVGENLVIIKSNQNPKFLSYALSSKFLKKQIKKLSQKSTVSFLTQNRLKQIKIPIPPIEIQKEIVEFLDKFFELREELEKELKCREEQLNYYKKILLSQYPLNKDNY